MMELMRQWVDYHIGTMDASKPRDLIGKFDLIIGLLSISYVNNNIHIVNINYIYSISTYKAFIDSLKSYRMVK